MVQGSGIQTPDPHKQLWSSMTPDERDRLTRLEGAVQQLARNDEHLESRIEKMDGKLDQLLTAAAMGKGAWWAILKVGGVIVMILSGLVWLWQQTGGRIV